MSNLKSLFFSLVPAAAARHLPAKAKLRFNVTKKQSFPLCKLKRFFLLECLAAAVTVVTITIIFKQARSFHVKFQCICL